MCFKIGLGSVFIDTIKNNRLEVIDFIDRAPSIENPKIIFKFSISSKAREKIELYSSK